MLELIVLILKFIFTFEDFDGSNIYKIAHRKYKSLVSNTLTRKTLKKKLYTSIWCHKCLTIFFFNKHIFSKHIKFYSKKNIYNKNKMK